MYTDAFSYGYCSTRTRDWWGVNSWRTIQRCPPIQSAKPSHGGVRRRDDESFEAMLHRFNQFMKKSGTKTDVRRTTERYLKPSLKRYRRRSKRRNLR